MEKYFKQQDEFLAELISAYESNIIGNEYEPYFAWKKGSPLFNREQCQAMRNAMREQLDALYNHAKHDDKLLTYLEAIDAELTNIARLLKQRWQSIRRRPIS